MSPVAESYLGISGYVIFWVLFSAALLIFVQRIYLLVRLLKLGRSENRFDRLIYRFTYMFVTTFFQWCNLRSVKRGDYAGIGHAFMFWGFCLFLLGYVIFIGLGGGFGLYSFFINTTFEKVYSSILDVAAVLILLTLIWAAIRRYIFQPERLKGHTEAEAMIILILISLLMVFHVCIEGLSFAASEITVSWPPVGGAIANFLKGAGVTQNTAFEVYKNIWWLHYILILGFLVFIPRSKHLHILASSINVAFKNLNPRGMLSSVDLNQTDVLGISKIQDFSWKHLLDGFACTVCGRCHEVCPARSSGKILSPRELVLNLKEHLLSVGPELLKMDSGSAAIKPKIGPSSSEIPASRTQATSVISGRPLIGGIIKEEEIWACTTCRACQEVCPSSNEQMNKIIEMRRYLQMNAMTDTGKAPLKSLETKGHPYRGTRHGRTDWTEGFDIKVLGEDSDIDTLFWVGCTGAMEDRSIKVTQAIARIMQLAGVKFGILGEEEACCGDPARRLGAEHIFQMLVQNNIQTLQMYNIKKIVTACPHCFNTLKNEYPYFNGQYEVIHHSQLIANLLKENKLKITKGNNSMVTYHDSCYLGRYNHVYQPPRQVLSSIPNVKLIEMKKNLKDGFCCGGGGGRIWLEETMGKRVSALRLEQSVDVKAKLIATACPFCLQMLEDAAKGVEKAPNIKDIAELVSESILQQ